jgi:hypothetical protein
MKKNKKENHLKTAMRTIEFNKYCHWDTHEMGAIRKMLHRAIPTSHFREEGKYIVVSRGIHRYSENSDTLPYFTYRVCDHFIDRRLLEHTAKYADIHAYIYDGEIVYRTQWVCKDEMVVF